MNKMNIIIAVLLCAATIAGVLFIQWDSLTEKGIREPVFRTNHHVNYFKIYHFDDLTKVALYSLPVFVIASFFVFRPFCQFVCPFGLWAWILESLAINRIKIDRDKCIQCNKCVESCPTQAMKGIYQDKRKFFLTRFH